MQRNKNSCMHIPVADEESTTELPYLTRMQKYNIECSHEIQEGI